MDLKNVNNAQSLAPECILHDDPPDVKPDRGLLACFGDQVDCSRATPSYRTGIYMLDEERLIHAIQEYPWLYDQSHRSYKDNIKKANAWEEVARMVESDVTSVKAKWDQIRSTYRRIRKRLDRARSSGSSSQQVNVAKDPKWWAYSLVDSLVRPHTRIRRRGGDSYTVSATSAHQELEEAGPTWNDVRLLVGDSEDNEDGQGCSLLYGVPLPTTQSRQLSAGGCFDRDTLPPSREEQQSAVGSGDLDTPPPSGERQPDSGVGGNLETLPRVHQSTDGSLAGESSPRRSGDSRDLETPLRNERYRHSPSGTRARGRPLLSQRRAVHRKDAHDAFGYVVAERLRSMTAREAHIAQIRVLRVLNDITYGSECDW